jgi:hypothetical protein
MIEYDIIWSAGQPVILMGSSYEPVSEWSAGQPYLLWELAEGFIFSEIEMEGVVIG